MRPEQLIQRRKKMAGLGLIAAIALITITAVISMSIMRSVHTSSDSSIQALVSYRAFLAAESGARLAANRLTAPLGSPACVNQNYNLGNMGLPSCRVEVECRIEEIDSEPLYTLQSTATCSPASFSASHSLIVRLLE